MDEDVDQPIVDDSKTLEQCEIQRSFQIPMLYSHILQPVRPVEESIDDEMQAFYDNRTFILVKRPKHEKTIKCRWVISLKDLKTCKAQSPFVSGPAKSHHQYCLAIQRT